jgi:hypothetical protein
MMRIPRAFRLLMIGFAVAAAVCPRGHAQGALLLQDSDGLSAALSPTGHTSVYFARICAASLTQLRRCAPGELGVVIARHRHIAGYDWLAVPLLPYLYSAENASDVPAKVNREAVREMRRRYHDEHLMSLGKDVPAGGELLGGWNEMVGAAYQRRIYALRFETSEEQDDAFIAKMNADVNRSHFSYLFRNCADFSGAVLDFYFPHTFKRRILPDLGVVSPRQVAYELARYARHHPEIRLTVMEIPLVPGYHRRSRVGKSAAASLIVSPLVIPIAFLSPYTAWAIVADGLVCGRYPLGLEHAQVLSPETMAILAGSANRNVAGKAQGGEALVASAAREARLSGPPDR